MALYNETVDGPGGSENTDDKKALISQALWDRVGEDKINAMSESRKASMQRTIDKLTAFKMRELAVPKDIPGLEQPEAPTETPGIIEPQVQLSPRQERVMGMTARNIGDITDLSDEDLIPVPEPVIPTKEDIGLTPEVAEDLQAGIERDDAFGRSAAVDAIKGFEGFREKAYYFNDDEKARDIVTVGYGTTNLADPKINIDSTMTEKEAETALNSQLDNVWDRVNNLSNISKTTLNPNQKAAVASLIYNIGEANWMKSNARKALLAGDFDKFKFEAFDEDQGFVKGSGKVIGGLQKRRRQEQELFDTEYEAV